MKKNFLSVVFLVLLISCSNEEKDIDLKINHVSIEYDKVNQKLSNGIELMKAIAKTNRSLAETFNSIKNGKKFIFLTNSKSENYNLLNVNTNVLYKKEDLPDIYSEKQKSFLIDFYNEIKETEDVYLPISIEKYKKRMKIEMFSEDEFNQINTIIETSKATLILYKVALSNCVNNENSYSLRSVDDPISAFLDCIREKGGRVLGIAMATGAITGAITGAAVGAAGGTVVLPGVGTATGATGGAVFGAVNGIVLESVVAMAWLINDCQGGRALDKLLSILDF